MKHRTCVLLLIGLLACGEFACGKTVRTELSNAYQPAGQEVQRNPQCLNQAGYDDAVKQLSSGNDTEASNATELLTKTSKISAQCRAEVIAILINSMNKPDLDFERDGDSYWLWRYGANLLGELQATEALDLLVSHLDLHTKMFSASMNHMPALRGVIKMGPVAIPKLDEVLQQDPHPGMRHAAVYCIATIGGPAAVQSLRQALPKESDKCVSRFIRISLDSFDDSGKIKDRGKWFSGGVCDE